MSKHSKKEQKKIFGSLEEFSEGNPKSGPGNKGAKIKSRKRAIAYGLSDSWEYETNIQQKMSGRKNHAR